MSRFLIVEDEMLVVMLLEDMLLELGHDVVATKHRIDQAAEAAEAIEIDAAILDLNLAGDSTFPIAEVLQRRGIPFIFSTGYGRAGLENRFSDMPVIAKPFTKDDLDAAITRLPRA
jgi:two-component SAPR family response regulator